MGNPQWFTLLLVPVFGITSVFVALTEHEDLSFRVRLGLSSLGLIKSLFFTSIVGIILIFLLDCLTLLTSL